LWLTEYVEELVQANAAGAKKLCEGTFLNPGSWGAALLAAGTTLAAMRHILDGHGNMTYALVRPPGHHAQPDRADGYCFLNNAGLAVQLALDSGRAKVAVVDIDVHYGNGTAEGFYRTDNVLTISLHMRHGSFGPSHPQSGSVDEIGEGKGLGYNLNIPLPNGSGDAGYEYAMRELVVPAIGKFQPQLLVFVIGQDSSAVSLPFVYSLLGALQAAPFKFIATPCICIVYPLQNYKVNIMLAIFILYRAR
jgi:acetoin utilization deacetylase AcuC-like enzyme